MSAITVENLGKRYMIGHQVRADTLRDALSHGARGFWQSLRRRRDARKAAQEEFWALKDVSFSVEPGEVLGIIGRNGAGKSTLLKILSRITEPTTGRVKLNGRVASLLEVGTGFHPELSGRENIFLNGAILGMSREEIRRKFDEIVAFAEIERFLDTPVKRYSSGMYVRLAFAVAAHLDPEILIVDEVLAVGDAQFQRKCVVKMRDFSAAHGRTVLVVSHRLPMLRELCTRGLLIQNGRLVVNGTPGKVLETYLHAQVAPGGTDDRRIRAVTAPPTIPSGTPLEIEMRISVPEGLPALHLRLTVYNEAGEAVAGFGTHLLGISLPATPGIRIFLFRSDPLPLSAGQYSINLAMCADENGQELIEHVAHAAVFVVAGGNPLRAQRWPERGVLAIGHVWSETGPASNEQSPSC